MSILRKIKLFFVEPKMEECIFSYIGKTKDPEYYFLMDVYFNVHDTKTKKFICTKKVTMIIDTENEIEQRKRIMEKHPNALNKNLEPRCEKEIIEKAKKVVTYADFCQFSKEGDYTQND